MSPASDEQTLSCARGSGVPREGQVGGTSGAALSGGGTSDFGATSWARGTSVAGLSLDVRKILRAFLWLRCQAGRKRRRPRILGVGGPSFHGNLHTDWTVMSFFATLATFLCLFGGPVKGREAIVLRSPQRGAAGLSHGDRLSEQPEAAPPHLGLPQETQAERPAPWWPHCDPAWTLSGVTRR